MSVIEAIRERKLRSLKASITYCDTRDRMLREKAEATKALIGKGADTAKIDPRVMKMSSLYYKMLDEYYAKSQIRMPHSYSKRAIAMWKRVADSCEQSEVEPESYIRAQFAFFHKAFGKPPELSQLATDNARTRAREFSGKPAAKVIGNDIKHTANFADKMRAAEAHMQNICRAQSMTRLEVYTKLVIPGLVVLPPEYLKADPVYKQALESVSK